MKNDMMFSFEYCLRCDDLILLNMSEKFLGKYRNGTTRLKSWNYCWNGYYFITICTKNRFEYFGEVIRRKMFLNKIGKIVNKYWSDIPNHFINVYIDEYIVMPNHIHGILLMNNKPHGGITK